MLHHGRFSLFELPRWLNVGQVALVACRVDRLAHRLQVFKLLHNQGILPMRHPIIWLAAELADVLEFLGNVSIRETDEAGTHLIWKRKHEFMCMMWLK
jgi:uncharacterized protein YcaQ